jgi:ATP-dependent RNA/DNA helicase IGHMBP2
MSKVQEGFKKLVALLKKEKEEDLRQYREKMLHTSLEVRRKEGVCWYPILLKAQRIGLGERLIIEIEKTHREHQDHLFSSGKMVSLFANTSDNPERVPQVNGVINYVQGHKMAITLNEDVLPEWTKGNKLGINLLFDESSYREMEFILKEMPKATGNRTALLRDIICGIQEPSFADLPKVKIDSLNESQNAALNKILAAKDIALVHGPPGTGKTTTLIQSIARVLKTEDQIMVCAPSNAAVDLLVEKLTDLGISVVRMGHPARLTETVLSRSFDALITKHEYFSDLKSLKRKADEYRSLAGHYSPKARGSERFQRKLLIDESRRAREDADQLEFYIQNSILGTAQVVACTLVGASHYVLRGKWFSTVFIDEAAQALEPASWIPIYKAQRLIMAGDHCQLPPTIKSFEAAKEGLEITLFEKLMANPSIGVMLQTQYRMNAIIMGFSAKWFYHGHLYPSPDVEKWQLSPHEAPLEFIDTAGASFSEEMEKESLSRFNLREAETLLWRLENTLEGIEHTQVSVGIISPYKAQVKLLDELLNEDGRFPLLKSFGKRLSVQSIDGFQGQERDIIAISLVRSNEAGEIGFLSDIRRMNVGLTRARKKLLVLGDSATIGSHPFYAEWLNYTQQSGLYRSVYEFPDLSI